MQIKRYTAADMRQALKLVREEQGPDAVILSSRKLDGRVEVTIAVDPEELELLAAAATPAVASTARSDSFEALVAAREAPRPAPHMAAVPAVDDALNGELRSLRRMLETQLAALAWNDLTRREPVAADLLRELTEFGFSRDIAAQVADDLPVGIDCTRARRLAIARLADRLPVLGDRWTEFGGRVALVGPAGSGKTTAIARMAARWVMRHGAAQVALVCADEQRFGAREELARIGRLLGVATFSVDGPAELAALNAVPGGVEVALTLAATTQAGAFEEAVQRFGAARPTACVLTRLDECSNLGGALSALIRARLPVAYVSEGQRIPDDLRTARALDLICMAVQLAERSGATADDELLSRRFGGSFHAA